MDEFYLVAAKSEPLQRGIFRVVSRDHTGRLTIHDFFGYEDARRYADNVASNWSTEYFASQVFNHQFSMVYEGRAVVDF